MQAGSSASSTVWVGVGEGDLLSPFLSSHTSSPLRFSFPHQWFVCFLACSLRFARSEIGALSRLRQLLIGGCRHVSADLDQHGLHGEVALPGCYARELGEVDLRGKGWVSQGFRKSTTVSFCPSLKTILDRSFARKIQDLYVSSFDRSLGYWIFILLLCRYSR
jgi:hypothetical protein